MIEAGPVTPVSPHLKLTAKEATKLAKETGMAPLKLKRIVAYSAIGKHLTENGALNVSRGMALVNIDDLEKLNAKIDKELVRASKGESQDAELMLELMKLKLQVATAQTEVIKTIANGTARLKDERVVEAKPENVPVLADLSTLLSPNAMKVTQTILEVEQRKSHEMVSEGDRQ